MSENHAEPQETIRKASSIFWKRCFKLGLIMIIPVGFLTWICLFRDTPLEISKETTYITEPLTADGKRVDYFRAMELERYPPNMKTDENGYRLIVRALGPMVDKSSPDAAILAGQVYEKLGLDPNVPPTMTFQDQYGFLKHYESSQITEGEEDLTEELEDIDLSPTSEEEYEAAENLEDKTGRPWTLEELPMMADWLKQNGPALDVIGKAVRKPEFCRPLTRSSDESDLLSSLLPDMQQIRSFARSLTARANYWIGTGDIDRAIDDTIACKALGRHTGKQGTLIDALVGIAIEGIANAKGVASSLEHQPTEAQLQRMLDELQKLPPRTTFEDVMLFERYYMLEMIQLVAKGKEGSLDNLFWNASGLDLVAVKSIKVLGFDWNTIMSRLNSYYDDLDEFKKLETRLRSSSKPHWLSLGALLPSSRSKILADYIAIQFCCGLDAVKEAFNRTECVDHIQAITLAMLIYEKQHGSLPPAYTVDKDGKPLHSWRVLLLPYLGEDAKKLYAQIRLDEPWDSKHNRRFHKSAIPFYYCHSAKPGPGETTYSVVVGKKTAFQGGTGKKLDQFGPNSANMILVLETNMPHCWMDPTSDETEGLTSISSSHPGVVIMGLRSGSIQSVSKDIKPENLEKGLEGTETDWNRGY